MPHWEELKQAIDTRGLTHLVSKDGKTAIKRLVGELEGKGEASDFDPLSSANWAICCRALEVGGLYLMTPDDQGNERCPLCELDKFTAKVGQKVSTIWIDGCCDAQLKEAQELKLVAVN